MSKLFGSSVTMIIRGKPEDGTLDLYEDHFLFLGKVNALNGIVDSNCLKAEKTEITLFQHFRKVSMNPLKITVSPSQDLLVVLSDPQKENELITRIQQLKKPNTDKKDFSQNKGSVSSIANNGINQNGVGQESSISPIKLKLIEAEKRRQQIAEENRRIAEEERRRKEEEERLRKEAEERKRKEEEERKRKEEEECKRKEAEERKRKEEEERKRREEAERKRLEQIKRREERIAASVSKAEQTSVDFSNCLNNTNKYAIHLISENPLYILGLFSNSSKKDANDSLEKYKKLARLKSEKAFKPLCVIKGLPVPERNISILQNAFIGLKDPKHQLLWFSDAASGVAWHETSYIKEFLNDGIDFATYDLFLANYLFALVKDAGFNDANLWKNVFVYINYILNGKRHADLQKHMSETITILPKPEELLNLFKNAIISPLEMIMENAEPESLLRLTSIIDPYIKTFDEFSKKLSSKITASFKSVADKLSQSLKDFNEKKDYSPKVIKTLYDEGQEYIERISPALKLAQSIYGSNSIKLEMINDTHKTVLWDLMCALNEGKSKDCAISVAKQVYGFCDDEDKRRLRRTFGFSVMKGIETGIPGQEYDLLGDQYLNGENGHPKDPVKAVENYQKAAKLGNHYSMNSLGLCYLEGKGVAKDLTQAVKYFQMAADKGNADGLFNLAWRYNNGEGVKKDTDKALKMWLDAANAGHQDALDVGKQVLANLQSAQKLHRLTQHAHYDLGYQMTIGQTVIVEVTLSHQANVYLVDSMGYQHYLQMENFTYYGGRATETPYRIKIPYSGSWHLVIDDGDNDMTFISTSVHTRTLSDY